MLLVLLPLLQVGLLAVTWFASFDLGFHRRLASRQEYLGHWACLDTFFLALGVVVFEIGRVLECL